jgi:hypothetical protein
MKEQDFNFDNVPENIQTEIFSMYDKYTNMLGGLAEKIFSSKNSPEQNFNIIGSVISSAILSTYAWSNAICGQKNTNKILEMSMLVAKKIIEETFKELEEKQSHH